MSKAGLRIVMLAGLSTASMSALVAAHVWLAQPPQVPAEAVPAAPAPGPMAAVGPPAAVVRPAAALPLGAALPPVSPSVARRAPVAVEPAPEAAEAPSSTPTFDVVRVEAGGSTVVAGRSGPNWRVELLANGVVIGRATANASGEWAIVPDRDLSAADHTLSLRARSPDGAEVANSVQTLVVGQIGRGERPIVLLNEGAAETTVLQTPDPTPPAASLAAAAPAAEKATAAALSGPVLEARPTPLAIEAVTYQAGKLSITGRAGAGVTLRVYLNDTFVKDVPAQRGERFSTVLDAVLPAGQYRLRIDAVSAAPGQVSARVEVMFEREPDAPALVAAAPVPDRRSDAGSGGAMPTVEVTGSLLSQVAEPRAAQSSEPRVVIIQRGDNLWRISHRSYGDGMRFTTIYRANQAQIRDPNLIFPGQIFVMPLPEPGRG